MARDPVPYATVEAFAKNIRELRELERSQSATQAELIRWCVRALKQTTDQAQRSLEAEYVRALREGRRVKRVRMSEPAKKVREDRAKAILHLEWLATKLENQSIGSPDTIDRKEIPCTAE